MAAEPPQARSERVLDGDALNDMVWELKDRRHNLKVPLARIKNTLAGGLVCLAVVQPLEAQTQPAPSGRAPIRLGPLYVHPAVELRDVGVDSNIFNDASESREDFTATVGPRIGGDVRIGSLHVAYQSAVDFVYFQTFKDQQSVNRRHTVRMGFEGTRVMPFVSAEMVTTRDRLNTELDARARRHQHAVSLGADFMLTPTTALVFQATRSGVNFDDQQFVRGTNLRETLNEINNALDAGLRFELTPLTAIVVGATVERREFQFSPERNSHSVRVGPAFEFRPSALIAGRAAIGYKSFIGRDALLPAFRGAVASANLTYTALQATRFAVQFERDVRYSFEEQGPYYLTNGARLGMSQHVVGAFDLELATEKHHRAYRRFGSVAQMARETVRLSSVGFAYRLGDGARVRVQLEYSRRRSDLPGDRAFARRRIVASTDYGL